MILRLWFLLTLEQMTRSTRNDEIEVVDSGPYLGALREAGVAAERVLLIPIQGEDFEAGM